MCACGQVPRIGLKLCARCAEAARHWAAAFARRIALERRWCRVALVAAGALKSITPMDRVGLSLGTAKNSQLAAMFGVRPSAMSALRRNLPAKTRRARTLKELTRLRVFGPELAPLHWEEYLPQSGW